MSGGGLGTGAGGLLGTLAGVALAPETGGLSMAIPALTGAAGAELGNMATGNTQNPLMAAFMGGVGGGLGGATDIGGSLGIGNAAGLFGDSASTAGADSGMSALSDIGLGANSSAMPSTLPSLDGDASDIGSGANSSSGSGVMNWLGKSQNLKNLGIGAGLGLPALEGIAQQFTLPKYNVQKNANSVLATNPQFNNPNLPQYSMQNTGTPYSGNWYTYGAQGNPSMYNAMPQPAKHGGMMHYAHGGRVHGYAMGGMPPAMGASPFPQQAAPQGMPQGQPQNPRNPLMLKVAHEVGVAVGEHIKRKRTPLGAVHGAGGGQDDAIPAKLSDGEFIMPADVVSKLGDGSSDAGGRKLMKVVHGVRAHTATTGFPPKSKANPLSYLNKGNI